VNRKITKLNYTAIFFLPDHIKSVNNGTVTN